jgi:hypothetical protein
VTIAVDSGSLGLFSGVSVSKTTGASSVNLFCPRTLLFNPLCTTFDHILRLTALLSIGKFQVETHESAVRAKPLALVVNQVGDY